MKLYVPEFGFWLVVSSFWCSQYSILSIPSTFQNLCGGSWKCPQAVDSQSTINRLKKCKHYFSRLTIHRVCANKFRHFYSSTQVLLYSFSLIPKNIYKIWASLKRKTENRKITDVRNISKSPGFDPSILRHSGIWGAADEAVLNKGL